MMTRPTKNVSNARLVLAESNINIILKFYTSFKIGNIIPSSLKWLSFRDYMQLFRAQGAQASSVDLCQSFIIFYTVKAKLK
jgi:hypothetical protein